MSGRAEAPVQPNMAMFAAPSCQPKRLRRCCSTPSLRQTAGEIDVYLARTGFREWGGSLATRLKPFFEDIGICHYMTILRLPDGRLIQYDFGPHGGRDVHVGTPAGLLDGPLQQPLRTRGKKRVMGEIRESQLSSLPELALHVGRTSLSVADIRAFNSVQLMHYELHNNDCRHYVNNLVRYTVGVERASALIASSAFKAKRDQRLRLADRWVLLGHALTDVHNWPCVCTLGQATLAAAAAWTGRRTVAAFARAPAPAVQTAALVSTRQLGGRLPRRPVYVAAGASVTAYATGLTEAPLLRDALSVGARMGDGLRTFAATALLNAAEAAAGAGTVRRAAATSAAGGVRGSVSLATSAAAGMFAMAGSATRGAAGHLTGIKCFPGSSMPQQAASVHARALQPRVPQLPRLHLPVLRRRRQQLGSALTAQ